MPDQKIQPMITVKKADGTFVKMKLSDLKQAQTKTSAPVMALPKETVKPAHHQAAHHAVAHHPVHVKTHTAHAAPIHHIKKITREDAGSLLEEKLKPSRSSVGGKNSSPLFSPKREKQVEEVLGKLGFNVAPDLQGRLKSLVLARLKDMKSEEETRELLGRSIKNGGLGLTEQQVEKIINSCQEVSSFGENIDVPVLKGKINNMALMVEPPELPMVVPNVILTERHSEWRNPLRSEVKGSLDSCRDDKQSVVSQLEKNAVAYEPVFKLNTRPAMKQSMNDVSVPDMEMGPVEEIKSVTLTDFRRLSGNPEEAAKRLQQKIFNLQDESFVWYLDALAAYHNSPLYSEYMQAVCQSIAERKSLANVLAMKNGVKLNEILSILEMEKGL